MAHDELWLSYHQVSRSNKPVTAQLIELEFQNQKLVDLEDVLDHLFHQGFVEARYRPVAFWENHEGQRIHGAHVVEDLLKNGTGKCSQTALHLVIGTSSARLSCLVFQRLLLQLMLRPRFGSATTTFTTLPLR